MADMNFKALLVMQIEAMREALEDMKDYYPLASKALRMYYEALIGAGFTETQAMQIVCTHGTIPKAGGN
jgi:ribosomal protein L19E